MAAPNSILHNFWLKLFSVALATVIWLAIHYGIRNELSISQLNINRISVPVAIITAPGDIHEFRITPTQVVVFAVGDVKALRRGIRAAVDLTNFHSRQSPAEEVRVEAPPEINVLEVSPATVAVEQVTK